MENLHQVVIICANIIPVILAVVVVAVLVVDKIVVDDGNETETHRF